MTRQQQKKTTHQRRVYDFIEKSRTEEHANCKSNTQTHSCLSSMAKKAETMCIRENYIASVFDIITIPIFERMKQHY